MRGETGEVESAGRAAGGEPAGLPPLGAFVVDTRFGATRAGRVTGYGVESVYLTQPGGGGRWGAPRGDLRPPTVEEWARIRVLITPVPALRNDEDGHQRVPDPGPVELTADAGPDPDPVAGCALCGLLARGRSELREGALADWSAASDCSVEIRNHPHAPPKLRGLYPVPRG